MAFGKKKEKVEEVTQKNFDELQEKSKRYLEAVVVQKIKELESEIAARNKEMDERDSLLNDSDYILQDIDIAEGFDATKYNFLNRAVDIHSSQVMGRGFNLVPKYDKEDLSIYNTDPVKQEEMRLKNAKTASQAASSKAAVEAVLEQNGGTELFKIMARTASAYGTGLIKKYYDPEEDTIKVIPVESPQNFRAGWSSDNFRDRDFDAMVTQISYDSAHRLYKDKLDKNEDFATDNSILHSKPNDNYSNRKMCTVIDFVGRIKGVNDNEPFHALIVGGKLVGYETRRKYLPKYYILPNKVRLRRPWGKSDLSDEAIDINKTYIREMSDQLGLIDRILFPFLLGKGFDEVTLPQKMARRIQAFAVGLEQDMQLIQFNPATYSYDRLLSETKENLYRELGVSRVLMESPEVNYDSSQALMTGMKPTIDIAEDKQVRWTPTLRELLSDILEDLKELQPKLKEVLGEVDLDIEWPSVLRKEDAAYNTTWFNNVSRGFLSLETYLSKLGVPDPQEEIDRIKSELEDSKLSSVLGANLRSISERELNQEDMAMQQQMMGANSQMGMAGGDQMPTNAPLTTDQNQPGMSPASAPGSGAPAVSAEGANATMMQNMGQ